MKILSSFFAFVFAICLLFVFAESAEAATPYMQGTARWNQMSDVAGYHIYYREAGETSYTHSVVSLPSTTTSYLIRYLKPGVRYWYNVIGVDGGGNELRWSGLYKLRVAWMP